MTVPDPVQAETTHERACGCRSFCGDDGDTEGPGTCKGLRRAPELPLVEIVLMPRAAVSPERTGEQT